MKRFINVILCASCLILLLEGCLISSIYPLWDLSTRIFDKSLAGEWYSPDDSTVNYKLSVLGDTAYLFTTTYDTKGEKLKFEIRPDTIMEIKHLATMVKLGKFTFLDLYPWDEDSEIYDRFQENFVPVHTFLKIEYENDILKVYNMDGEHLDELFEKNRIRLKHEMFGDYTLLTASTNELQEFMKKYADDPEAFEEPSILYRR